MLLALDIGNTNIVAGLFAADGPAASEVPLAQGRFSTHPYATADELRLKLAHLLEHEGSQTLRSISAVIIGSVVPALTEPAKEAAQRLWPQALVHVVNHRSPLSFSIEASPPDCVGADRLINAEAAWRRLRGPCIIVDSGTATTLCALAVRGGKPAYLGGAILPGLELSRDSIAKRAAKLYAVELDAPEHAIGRNTTEALQSGLMLGYAAMIDGLVARFKGELAERHGCPEVQVIGTGGVCARLRGLARSIELYDPDLTLKGIRCLHERLLSQ